jgi:hypothetical protein
VHNLQMGESQQAGGLSVSVHDLKEAATKITQKKITKDIQYWVDDDIDDRDI